MNELTQLKPFSLEKGSKVAIVNPVSVQPEKFHANGEIINYLSSFGLEVEDFTDLCGTEQDRISMFNRALNNGSEGLFPVTGNDFGAEVVDEIDYKKFEEIKPIFTTFSAASTFLLALHSNTRVRTFYGPHISFLHTKASYRENQFTSASYLNMIFGSQKRWGLNGKLGGTAYRNIKTSEGILMRNILSMRSELNTTYNGEPIPFVGQHSESDYLIEGDLLPAFVQGLARAGEMGISLDIRDNILMLESNDISFEEAIKYIKRINEIYDLTKLSAIVLASFVHRSTSPGSMGYSLYDEERVSNFMRQVITLVGDNIPVIYGFPIGHGRYKLTVPIGINSKLDIRTGDIYFTEDPLDARSR